MSLEAVQMYIPHDNCCRPIYAFMLNVYIRFAFTKTAYNSRHAVSLHGFIHYDEVTVSRYSI
jgi:hypothetical protein